MAMKITLAVFLLLASSVEANKKRPLTPIIKNNPEPMIAAYKKRNPIVEDTRHCGDFVTV